MTPAKIKVLSVRGETCELLIDGHWHKYQIADLDTAYRWQGDYAYLEAMWVVEQLQAGGAA
jgi:UDP-2,3-diacylglucosamine pyrophosphatase LpxH